MSIQPRPMMPRNRIRDFLVHPKNRIRSYTRWPLDKDERVRLAKIDAAALAFCQRVGGGPIPDDILKRANAAVNVLGWK